MVLDASSTSSIDDPQIDSLEQQIKLLTQEVDQSLRISHNHVNDLRDQLESKSSSADHTVSKQGQSVDEDDSHSSHEQGWNGRVGIKAPQLTSSDHEPCAQAQPDDESRTASQGNS